MALLSDGPIITIEDLNAYDSSVLEVAHTETIDLSRKLELAQDEIRVELESILPRSVGEDADGAREPEWENVVVTPPLRLWHVFQTLALVYRDAYGSQLNDRYQARRDEYDKLAQWARRKLEQTGIGFVWEPMARAAAPQLTPVAGTLGPAIVFACVAFLSASGAEGAAGPSSSLEVGLDHSVAARPVNPPVNATHWNVFAGSSADRLVGQNAVPLALDAEWIATNPLAMAGRRPGNGQEPDSLRPVPHLRRW